MLIDLNKQCAFFLDRCHGCKVSKINLELLRNISIHYNAGISQPYLQGKVTI